MQQGHPEPITLQDGAVGGFLAGIVGAFVYTIVAVPVQLLMAPIQRRVTQNILDAAREIPPELRGVIESLTSGASASIIALMFMFFVMLVVGMIFSTIGGVLGAFLFRRHPPPSAPGTVDVLPPGVQG